MQNPQLLTHNMETRHNGLSQATAGYLTEGARVCLDRHHQSPAMFEVRGLTRTVNAVAEWQPTDVRTKSAWANAIDATEAGACAFALAAVELLEGLITVRRAETETGADYYVAPLGTDADDFESCIRLEVAGRGRGSAATIARTLNEKLAQAARGNSNLPAIAGVVGFHVRLIRLARLEDT